MKNNETGEYELVVGNGQLLSGFFIVVLLCAVAFAMGYVVGQNTPRSAKPADSAAAASGGPDQRPQAVSPAPVTPSAPPPTSSEPVPATVDPGKPVDTPPQPTTQPARETAPPPTAAPAPQPPPATSAAASDTAGNKYWQVAAYKQAADADIIYQTLKDGSMPVTLKPGADGWVRVLVGPYSDAASLNRAKKTLETQFNIHNLFTYHK
jgi:cell division septation protein DedD